MLSIPIQDKIKGEEDDDDDLEKWLKKSKFNHTIFFVKR